MNQEKIKVDLTILTANYNNGVFVEQLIQSVINSTVFPQQFIIIDDGSNDESINIISKYVNQYPFLELISLSSNVGFANALNCGIERIQCNYTVRVDADDYIAPERLEIQYNYMIANANVDVLGSNIEYFDSISGKKIFKSNVALNNIDIRNTFLNASCGIIHGSTIIKSSLLKKYLYIQDSVPAEDYEIFSKMLKDGAVFANLSLILTFVRVHFNSVSNFLPFKTIEKTYNIAHQIWGVNYTNLELKFKYFHLKYYRSFLFEKSLMKKCYFVFLSLLFCPSKILKRFSRK